MRIRAYTVLATLFISSFAVADDRPADSWLESKVNRISHKERELPWLVGDCNIYCGIVSAAVVGYAASQAANDSPFKGLGGAFGVKGDVVNMGDDLYTLPTASGYVTSLLAKDYRGFAYMGIHNAFSSAVMQALKDEVRQRRPGDQSNSSFPSGHTNTAFLGAAFMQQRYGSRWGVPSYVTAIAVAWSRIYGNKHYVNDTIAGASIGMMSAWWLVPPYESERRDHWADLERERPLSYEFEMTLNDVDKNLLQSPASGGDVFTSPLDRQVNEPWANSHIEVEYRPNDKQSWSARFTPWEIRSFGQFSQSTTFAGSTFPASQQLRVAHFLWNYGAQYRHTMVSSERAQLRLGGGLSGQSAEQEIFIVDDTQPERRGQTAKASADVFYAVAHVDADFNLFWKLWLSGELDYGTSGDSTFTDWSARLKIRFSPKWDASVGWREFSSDIKESSLRNDFQRSGPAFNFVYSF